MYNKANVGILLQRGTLRQTSVTGKPGVIRSKIKYSIISSNIIGANVHQKVRRHISIRKNNSGGISRYI